MAKVEINTMTAAILMRLLCEGGSHTANELAEESGMAYTTVLRWVRALHKLRVIFIAGYEKDMRGRDNAPLWKLGIDHRDTKRHKLSGAERQQLYRERRKQAQLLGILCLPKTQNTKLIKESISP